MTRQGYYFLFQERVISNLLVFVSTPDFQIFQIPIDLRVEIYILVILLLFNVLQCNSVNSRILESYSYKCGWECKSIHSFQRGAVGDFKWGTLVLRSLVRINITYFINWNHFSYLVVENMSICTCIQHSLTAVHDIVTKFWIYWFGHEYPLVLAQLSIYRPHVYNIHL